MSTHRRLVIAAVAVLASLTLLGGMMVVIGGVGSALAFTEHTERSYAEPVERLVLDLDDGDVEVVAVAGLEEVRVRRSSRRFIGEPEISERLLDGVLALRSRCSGLHVGPCSTDYRVEAPPGVALAVDGTAGDVTVRGLDGDLSVATTAGDVEVVDVRAREIRAGSTAGDITVSLRSAPGRLRAETTAGDVEVRVPAGTYDVETDTTAGDESIEGLVDDPAARRSIEVRTTAGDAAVRAR